MLSYLWNHPAIVGIPVLLGISLLAIVKGGAAARQASLLNLGFALGVTGLHFLPIAPEQVAALALVGDALLALGFLWLALRHRSLWLAGAMMAQGTAFAFHAFLLEQQNSEIEQKTYLIFAVGMNLMTWMVMLLILTGTIIFWRRNQAAKRRKAAAAMASADNGPMPPETAKPAF